MAKCAVIVCGVVFAAFFLYAHAEIGADLDERMSVGRSLLGDDSFTDSWKEFDAAHQQEKEKKDSKGPRPCPPPVNINANNNRGGDGGQTGDGGDGGAGGGGGGGGGSADGGDAVVIGMDTIRRDD
ncbi:hypothetical protein BSKO_12404 [Bryopsis sp. KO-2023]|nr:hypothetical protein BSKO_12404 [Bryopsis sp. KO-2023]